MRADGAAPVVPQPGWEDVEDLLTRRRARIELDGRPPAGTTCVAVYRILQEALRNAERHAPGQAVDVSVIQRTTRWRCGSASPVEGATSAAGAGHGIISLRERAAAVGGRCVAEVVGGTWTVTAELTDSRSQS
ncbi:hypothetical protein [Amycolatopsis suaedae]|uniref:ATP-binding protein n=1 Tax=Amycolatopsis suaedae TaxID=2510978 RepID=UPI001F0E3520|nr:hypothetical protein [Amycolatopsis suaedae]